MQLVFLNTLEKQSDEGRVVAAQVSIGESQGTWSVVWTEPGGGSVRTDIWYEGSSWEEMISTFRHGVAVKLGEGYEPVLDGMLDDRKPAAGSYVSMLHATANCIAGRICTARCGSGAARGPRPSGKRRTRSRGTICS
jgi:hypothetical protein